MHKALYRKWRPQTFSDVCGQEHITSVLSWQVKSGKPSHAYLFCGSRGTGKTTCAKILAKAVNCEAPADGNPCGVCPSCVGIERGAITDVTEMDAASNNGVEDVRSIREDVVYSPSGVKYRVYIIDEVHMLSVSAFNALLKTLEEPPSHVIFILATTELQKLPATIISRCQRFDFRRITVDTISARLMHIAEAEGMKLEKDAAALIAKLAGGGMRDAISMLELCAGEVAGDPDAVITAESVGRCAGVAGRGTLCRTVEAVIKRDILALFDIVAQLYASSLDIGTFWQDLTAFYRDMMIIKVSSGARTYLDMTEAEYEDTARIAAPLRRETITYHLSVMDKALSDMQRGALPKRLCAELALVRMTDPSLSGRDSALDALTERVAALEDALASGAPAPKASAPTAPEEGTADMQKAVRASSETGAVPEANGNGEGGRTEAVKPPPAPAPIAPEAETVPHAEDSSAGQTAAEPQEQTRELKPIGYYSEMIADYDRTDRSKTELLRLTRAYRTQDGVLVIKTGESFIHMMLNTAEVRERLLASALRYDKTLTSVSVERGDEDDGGSDRNMIDILAEDSEN